MSAHPCPKPALHKRQRVSGLLWACECGKVYAHRFRSNYGGEWWEWEPTALRTGGEG